jgi:hypothetical protein
MERPNLRGKGPASIAAERAGRQVAVVNRSLLNRRVPDRLGDQLQE